MSSWAQELFANQKMKSNQQCAGKAYALLRYTVNNYVKENSRFVWAP